MHRIRFSFPNFEAKYWHNCYILDYDPHSSRKCANFDWIATNMIRKILPLRVLVEYCKILLHIAGIRYTTWAFVFGDQNIGHTGGTRTSRTSKETIEQIQDLSYNDFNLSIRAVPSSITLPPTTVHFFMGKCLFSFPYKFKNFQSRNERDKQRLEYDWKCSTELEGYSYHLSIIRFSDKYMFRRSNVVNKQKKRTGGLERPN